MYSYIQMPQVLVTAYALLGSNIIASLFGLLSEGYRRVFSESLSLKAM